jgi:hypothetical protein
MIFEMKPNRRNHYLAQSTAGRRQLTEFWANVEARVDGEMLIHFNNALQALPSSPLLSRLSASSFSTETMFSLGEIMSNLRNYRKRVPPGLARFDSFIWQHMFRLLQMPFHELQRSLRHPWHKFISWGLGCRRVRRPRRSVWIRLRDRSQVKEFLDMMKHLRVDPNTGLSNEPLPWAIVLRVKPIHWDFMLYFVRALFNSVFGR